ncbi:hypothetical protein B0T26DRAFT_720062 [Lasiosphaeria miniovina]|uniref:Uncharacterized protein n=1 Tax=Lasiosphaeria miniovina TaxID=1954250 RepID=A0AA40DPZ9_9PEZI|nr:uncharacterized protein B0T26DRAFT_720062 [Lasiosphaeria miniovina]KAK0708982.1 hypothetical protein B0T26DRAFT_720062 [Lasiosphaeria miniovina]
MRTPSYLATSISALSLLRPGTFPIRPHALHTAADTRTGGVNSPYTVVAWFTPRDGFPSAASWDREAPAGGRLASNAPTPGAPRADLLSSGPVSIPPSLPPGRSLPSTTPAVAAVSSHPMSSFTRAPRGKSHDKHPRKTRSPRTGLDWARWTQ